MMFIARVIIKLLLRWIKGSFTIFVLLYRYLVSRWRALVPVST